MKSCDNDNDDNNDDGQRANFDQKSSFEPSAQVSLKEVEKIDGFE